MSNWKIIPHSGCSTRDFEDDLGFNVQQAPGTGMPSVDNVAISYGLLDGDIFQRTRAEGRGFVLAGGITASDLAALNDKRKDWVQCLAHDHISPQEPIVIQYDGGACTLQASAYYDGGFELGQISKANELGIGLRFYCPDPCWEKTTTTTCDLSMLSEVDADGLIHRSACGEWSNLGACPGGAGPNALVWDSTGSILYIGGNHRELAASATGASYVGYWNSTTGDWSPMGDQINNTVNTIALGPGGAIYAGGNMTTPAPRCGEWTGASWAAMTSSGMSGTVFSMVVGHDGTVYAGGAFAKAGSNAACNVAYYDSSGSEWLPVGNGVTAVDSVIAMAIGPDDDLYVVGSFDTASGTSACCAAKWDVSASGWLAVGSGMQTSATVYDLVFGDDGTLHAGGTHTKADGDTTACYASQWNGVVWQPMGKLSGATVTSVTDLAKGPEGSIYAVGAFTKADGVEVPGAASWNGLAKWTGSQWTILPLKVGHSYNDVAVNADGDLVLGIGGTEVASAVQATTITNNGTAVAYPIVTACGPGRMMELTNYTTDESIHFNLNLNDGETVTLDLRQGAKTLTSDLRGSLLGNITPTSDLSSWHLKSGTNRVLMWIDDSTASATMQWTDRYWSLDS